MKRGLTILTAALFAGALAVPAMAQSTDNGVTKEAPAASAVTNPTTAGAENAANPAADENAAKADSGEMKQGQKPAEDSSQPKETEGKADTNATGDAVSNPAGAAPGHAVE